MLLSIGTSDNQIIFKTLHIDTWIAKQTTLLDVATYVLTAIEIDVIWVCYPCDIFISVKGSPLLCFQVQKSEEDRKAMTFDLKGWLLPLENVRPEINGLMP